MGFKLVCVFLVFLLIGCESPTLTCKEIGNMYALDQKYRSSPCYNPYMYIAENLRLQDSVDSKYPENISKHLNRALEIFQENPDSIFYPKAVEDSCQWNQKMIDIKNVSTLFKLLKNTNDRILDTIGCKDEIGMIFLHCDTSQMEEARVLLSEYPNIFSKTSKDFILGRYDSYD